MILKSSTPALGAALLATLAGRADRAVAQAKEQFFPLLVYRTGAYAPNGTPWANGKQDYIKMINARDGGINGVKITFEECETGYATDRGVECYERLKGKHGGATLFEPQSTGITFALTDKAPGDKIPLLTVGYGRVGGAGRLRLQVELPDHGQLLDRRRHPGPAPRQEGRRLDKLKGKKIALVYHDSPVRQGADPAAAGARQAERLRAAADSGRPPRASSRRRPGCRSARAGPTTCCCGAGAS